MKILQVLPYFCFGGAETMCENLTYALARQGHDVVVVSLYAERTPISQRMEEAGIRILYLDKKLGLDLSMIPKLCAIMKREKPDAVHTHLNVLKYAGLAAKLTGVPCTVHTVHSVAQKEEEGLPRMANGCYFHMGWVTPVALSPEVQSTICEVYGLPEKRVPVVYNSVDLSRCIPKQTYELGAEPKLLHMGRFNEAKNHKGLLRAFRQVLEQMPQCRLTLLGDGELREEIENDARELGIGAQVDFLGNQSDVYPYLHDADIFLLPSNYEGMPMSIIEAMGTGLPIVATPVGGIPDMLRDGEDGLLPANEEAIAMACLRLLRDENLRRTLGRSAAAASARFSAATMAEDYVRIYSK